MPACKDEIFIVDPYLLPLRFTRAAEHMLILPLDHLNELVPRRSKILAGIELGRVFGEYFSYHRRYGQPSAIAFLNISLVLTNPRSL